MNFCPDETPLVLEIFKSLGSENAIQDVPVRFRTKDGRIKHLLIDSIVSDWVTKVSVPINIIIIITGTHTARSSTREPSVLVKLPCPHGSSSIPCGHPV